MPSQTSKKQETTAEVTPIKAMRGHTSEVRSVVHLPGGRRNMTCSLDSLRLCDLESGTQIGEDWRDDETKEEGVCSIALSPNGKTVVSGSGDGKMKLWDVETRKVVAKWMGHAVGVTSVCWSAGGDRVVSGSTDSTARVWNATRTGKRLILKINTGHQLEYGCTAVIYSPNNTQIATGGCLDGAKIWDVKTGLLIAALEHDSWPVFNLAWTSDGKKLFSIH